MTAVQKPRLSKLTAFFLALTIVFFLVLLVGCAPQYDGPATSCTVTEKEQFTNYANKTATTEKRVYSSCGVFGVQDDFTLAQWNSADTYNSIEVGKTYDFEAYGWRNGFFSQYPNILNATEVAQ